MSQEHPSFPVEDKNALKNEAHSGGLPTTKHVHFFVDGSSPTTKNRSKSPPTSSQSAKDAVSETAHTVVSDEPLIDVVYPDVGTGRSIPGSDNTHAPEVQPPPSGIHLSPGMMLGHFTVTKFIGGGGMGRVYLGFDKSLDRKVAIKVLQRQRAQDQFSVARFMNEARSAARLNHEHIAQVYFAGQQDEIPFIAFEFVEGTNIRTIVERRGPFPLSQAITYLIQISHALDHAAVHGVIHRDVKPSNILITKEGRAKLIDMGLARLLKPTDPGDDLTASGVTLGTFDYISPEQARDPRNADIRSDIYSLGCTLFFMLTGRPPFHEGTVLQKLLQHQGDEPPDIRSFIPGAPPEVAHILQKMMAKDPRQRYQTPALLLKELTGIAGKLGLRPSGPGKAVWTMRSDLKHPSILSHVPWVSGIILFLAAFVVLNLYWPKGDIQPPPIPPPLSISQGKEPLTTSPGGTASSENVATQTPSGTESLAEPDRVGRERMVPQFWSESDWSRHSFRSSASETLRPEMSASITPFRLVSSVPMTGGLGVGLRSESLASRSYGSNVAVSVSLWASKPTGSSGAYENNRPVGSTLLIVDPANPQSEEGVYSSLAAAVAAAGKNATIELRYSGNAGMKIEPMSLVGKHLTIQAGKRFSPVLQFQPLDSAVVKEDGRIFLFLVNGGSIQFNRITLEMDVSPNVLAEKWSMFDMLGPSQLQFTECVFTVRNTLPGSLTSTVYHNGVSIFRTASPANTESNGPGGTIAKTTGGSTASNPFSTLTPNAGSRANSGTTRSETGEGAVTDFQENGEKKQPAFSGYAFPSGSANDTIGQRQTPSIFGTESFGYSEREPQTGDQTDAQANRIVLKDCIIRGEATVLLMEANRATALEMENVFAATDLPFIHLKEIAGLTKETGRKVTISAQHVSLFCKSKLNRFAIRDNAFPMSVRWTSKFSVFRLNNTPINEFFGFFLKREEIPAYSEWDGEYNFFQDVSNFTEIKASSSVTHPPTISLDDWKSEWSSPPTIGTDIFQLPIQENRATSRMVPSDLSLSQRTYLKVPRSENDRQTLIDAGAIYDLLPKLQMSLESR